MRKPPNLRQLKLFKALNRSKYTLFSYISYHIFIRISVIIGVVIYIYIFNVIKTTKDSKRFTRIKRTSKSKIQLYFKIFESSSIIIVIAVYFYLVSLRTHMKYICCIYLRLFVINLRFINTNKYISFIYTILYTIYIS